MPFIHFKCYPLSRWARILFYCKILRIGIYSIRLTLQIVSEPFAKKYFGPNCSDLPNLLPSLIQACSERYHSLEWFKTLHCIPNLVYRHSVEFYRTVRNDYTVSVRWNVKTVQCSLPMCSTFIVFSFQIYYTSSNLASGRQYLLIYFGFCTPTEMIQFRS